LIAVVMHDLIVIAIGQSRLLGSHSADHAAAYHASVPQELAGDRGLVDKANDPRIQIAIDNSRTPIAAIGLPRQCTRPGHWKLRPVLARNV
jgi:hypothetical protein